MASQNQSRLNAWTFSAIVCSTALLVGSPGRADNHWTSFRGDGSSVVDADLPTQWSPEEVTWQTEIPGYGQSAPVIWDGQVYVTSSEGAFQQDCQVHAFDLRTGEKNWTKQIVATTPVENYFRNSRAAPTCCVDASGLFSFFPSGDVTAMTHAGEQRWSLSLFKKYGEVQNERGVASSLAQTDNHLYVLIDHHGPSYLVAVNKADGSIAWKTDRGDRIPSWSSPVIAQINGRKLVITSSADTVDAYDASTGETLWQHDGLQGNHIPSPSVVGDRIFVGSTTMYGGATDADATAGSNCCLKLTEVEGKPSFDFLWGAERANSYYSTPLAFAGYVYYVNKVGVLYCVDQETGKQVFAKRIGTPCWASAVGVTNPSGESLVYFVLKNGFTLVLRPGDEYDQVARNQLYDREAMLEAQELAAEQRRANAVPSDQVKPKSGPEKVFAGMPESQLHKIFSYGDPMVYGVAVAEDRLLIRTGQTLFCVGG